MLGKDNVDADCEGSRVPPRERERGESHVAAVFTAASSIYIKLRKAFKDQLARCS